VAGLVAASWGIKSSPIIKIGHQKKGEGEVMIARKGDRGVGAEGSAAGRGLWREG